MNNQPGKSPASAKCRSTPSQEQRSAGGSGVGGHVPFRGQVTIRQKNKSDWLGKKDQKSAAEQGLPLTLPYL
jgi:hypothetical protein